MLSLGLGLVSFGLGLGLGLEPCGLVNITDTVTSEGGVLISLSRPSINHWSLWRTASATPDIRLPSRPQGITAPWPVPDYTAWLQRHMCLNNLPKVVAWKRYGRESSRYLLSGKSDAITITPTVAMVSYSWQQQQPASRNCYLTLYK